jgi:cysteine desulfurase
MESMCSLVEDAVRDAFPDAERLGHPRRRLPHILSLQIPGVVGETLMLRCDARGVAFSTGSACHGHTEPKRDPKKPDNHVLAAIGMDRQSAREVIRVSFSRETTREEAEIAAEVIVEEAEALLSTSPSAGVRR